LILKLIAWVYVEERRFSAALIRVLDVRDAQAPLFHSVAQPQKAVTEK
jgi:hypothetical protein